MSGLALARLDDLVQRRQIQPLDERPNRAYRMILRNQIVQCCHLHTDLTAFWHPQPQRTAHLRLRSLLLGQILEQLLVSHPQPLLRAQCQRITAWRPWQTLVTERFSHSEELAAGGRLEGWAGTRLTTRVRVLAARDAQVVRSKPPSTERGRRECRMRVAPEAACATKS